MVAPSLASIQCVCSIIAKVLPCEVCEGDGEHDAPVPGRACAAAAANAGNAVGACSSRQQRANVGLYGCM